MPVYVIYDLEKIWPRAYHSFADAYSLVVKHINMLNKPFIVTSNYYGEPPASMDEYDINMVKEGIMVANVDDYDQQIFIKELSL
jgi:hypothetical protein